MSGTSLITLRLPTSLVSRADALLSQLTESEETIVLGRASRSIVLRLAVLRGLEQLEAQAAANKGPAPNNPGGPSSKNKKKRSMPSKRT